MKRDGSETVASNGEEAPAAQQNLPSARSFPVSLGRASPHNVLPNTPIEALLRQALEGDQEAWAGVEQSLGETVHSWLRSHPSKEAACCWVSEEHYVSLAFERFRQAVSAGQLPACTSLSTVLRYLQACLYGVLLDALRVNARPSGIVLKGLAHVEEQPGRDHPDAHQLWERIQGLFPDVRVQRVAYLLFHCHLSPSEIFCFAPQQFRDVQEICDVRRHILERILLHSDLIP
jgi:hypothetical protein